MNPLDAYRFLSPKDLTWIARWKVVAALLFLALLGLPAVFGEGDMPTADGVTVAATAVSSAPVPIR